MQTILKKTIKEKIILDREHQKIVTELDGTIDRQEKELLQFLKLAVAVPPALPEA